MTSTGQKFISNTFDMYELIEITLPDGNRGIAFKLIDTPKYGATHLIGAFFSGSKWGDTDHYYVPTVPSILTGLNHDHGFTFLVPYEDNFDPDEVL